MVGKVQLKNFIPMKGWLTHDYVHTCGKQLTVHISMHDQEGTWKTDEVQHFVEERPANFCPECGEMLAIGAEVTETATFLCLNAGRQEQ